ncbi:hypothetical protein [Dysgonomonas sp. 520]|uniref:hypothetical protein n=1 Tax=Dysgonomonas sp. 520 TaxID=2302931 RepID=UPI0013D07838|nr:hypothetical protein [Dysgonomonas sp. 520]NDW09067.1 hypothetical protein [Dysgonomonas sp. 520]
MARKSKNNGVLWVILCILAAFLLGIKIKSDEDKLKQKALETAAGIAVDTVKSEAAVTKAWFNQLTNTWKQIWS